MVTLEGGGSREATEDMTLELSPPRMRGQRKLSGKGAAPKVLRSPAGSSWNGLEAPVVAAL